MTSSGVSPMMWWVATWMKSCLYKEIIINRETEHAKGTEGIKDA